MAVVTTRRFNVDSPDKEFFKAMGARIARARKALNLTQQQLAVELGIVQQTEAHYEVGRIRVPSTMLPKLAEKLGLTWFDPAALYRWHGHEWTFRQYVLHYIRWAPYLD